MRQPAHTYRQFSVQGATPLGLVVMLYDGAIAAMQRAVMAIEAHDIQSKCTHLNRAQAIIAQLEGTLNFEMGGEVAQTLKSLYTYARAQVMKANIHNSPEMLRSLIENFSTVREAWYEAEHKQQPSPSAPSASVESRREAWYEAQREELHPPSAPTGEEPPRAPALPREPGSWRMSA